MENQGESSYLLFGDLRVHYLRWPSDPDGSPVMLMHGLASNARIWQKVAPILAEHGLRPYASDARGHGLTDKPDGSYGFEVFSGDLRSFLETSQLERPVLIGHSWGAHLALDYAARFPRGPRSPSALILVDGGITQLNDNPDVTWEVIEQRLAPPRLAGMSLERFLSLVREHNRAWQMDDESLSIILANFEIQTNDHNDEEIIFPHLTFKRHMQIVRALWEFETYERFKQVACPVLVVPARPGEPIGEGEREFLEAKERGLEQARKALPALQVRWMPNSIHDIPLQRPEELAETITNFIDNYAKL